MTVARRMTYSGLLSCPVLTPYSVGAREVRLSGEAHHTRWLTPVNTVRIGPTTYSICLWYPLQAEEFHNGAPIDTSLPARERSGQIEPWDHAVFKAGHGGDLVATEREYIEADPVANAIGGA